MKIFNPPTLQNFELEQVTLSNKRYYIDKAGAKFYSVTTMLSKTADKSFLEKWRKSIGNEEADKIVKQSTTFGTKLHGTLEKLLLNEKIDFILEEDKELESRFTPIKDYLLENVSELLGSEIPLFSKQLKLAGTCDLVYKDNSGNIIIGDFKTSKKKKKLEWCEDYCLQICCYAVMLNELYNISTDYGRLLFSYEDGSFEIISFNPTKYFGTLKKRLNMFKTYIKDEQIKEDNTIF